MGHQVPPSPAQPATQEGSFQPWASQSPYPGTPGYDPAQSFGQVAAPFTPAHSAWVTPPRSTRQVMRPPSTQQPTKTQHQPRLSILLQPSPGSRQASQSSG